MKKVLFLLLVTLSGVEGFSQDSTNTFDYNYRKGMEHYNKGVGIFNNTIPVPKVIIDQDSLSVVGISEFNQALMYLSKAYSINSKNEKVLKGLQGVYFAMYDFKESDRYKNELEALKKKN